MLRTTLAVALAVSGASSSLLADDTIAVSGGSGSEIGVLVDGRDAGGVVNDRGFVSPGPTINVGQLAAAPSSNEAILFTAFRPPKHLATPWTTADDALTVSFNAKITLPITVWIVKGPFNDQRTHAIEACVRTSAIWNAERVGVCFSQFEVIDATADPDAPSLFAFPNGNQGDVVWKPLRDKIGFKTDRINVYWVDTVDGSTTKGWSNFGQQIAMARNSSDDLLAHEIGHAFSLWHTNSQPNFDGTGVMHSSSNIRAYLSEGELFRAHFNAGSALNATYSARPGEPQRTCGIAAVSATCVAIDRRLWPDGAFPAN